MSQKVLFISDSVMNSLLKDFNRKHNSNYGFVWCPEYCNLVDFDSNSRIDFSDSLRLAVELLSYDYSEIYNIALPLIQDNESHWEKYFNLFHDVSRKTYILYWEEHFGEIGIL